MNADQDVINRAVGCLMGQATGDALGTTVEFRNSQSISREYPDGVQNLVGGGPFGLLPGQITDDTELAMALARSLVKEHKYDDDMVAAGYKEWIESDPFDVGMTTRSAFSCRGSVPVLSEKMRLHASPDSQSNGSLMRQSPLGIFGWNMSPDQLADLSCRDSKLSHPHLACQESCVAYTYAIATAIRTGASHWEIYRRTLEFMGSRPEAVSSGVVGCLEKSSVSAPDDFYDQMGWVLKALQNAFYQLLYAKTIESGIIDTVRRGGDTDTNGCIAGSLLGAVYGEQSIPERWTSVLLACQSPRPSVYHCNDIQDLSRLLLG